MAAHGDPGGGGLYGAGGLLHLVLDEVPHLLGLDVLHLRYQVLGLRGQLGEQLRDPRRLTVYILRAWDRGREGRFSQLSLCGLYRYNIYFSNRVTVVLVDIWVFGKFISI